MRTNFLNLALIAAFFAFGPVAAHAGEKVRVCLYFAENAKPSEGTKVAPEHLQHRLHQVFGFHHYELVHEQDVDMHKEWEHWVIPRKDFFIRIEPLAKVDAEPRHLDYEIYKDGFIVAKGKYEPHEETPLFINGPDFKSGRFIFVLEAKD